MVILTILIFIAILGLLVFVHELGHFIMAKRAGMKVEEFGFGFPPRMFGIRRGETIYSINWIPLGGFVKIMGEDGLDSSDPRNFGNKSFSQRLLVMAAGVSMNLVLAWLLISIGLAVGLPTVIGEQEQLSKSAKVSEISVAVIDVVIDSPAQLQGLKVGDKIVRINGDVVDSTDEVLAKTQAQKGQATIYAIKRGSQEMDIVLTPRENPPQGQGPLGIALSSLAKVSYPWYEAIVRGLTLTFGLLYATVSAFVTIIGQWIGGQPVSADLSGPVGIAVITRDVAQLGFIYILQFTAILSINLAVINAVPFPALDGGRILFLFIEKLRRKKLPVKAEQIANTVGFALLLLLMAVVTIRDVGKFDLIQRIKGLFS